MFDKVLYTLLFHISAIFRRFLAETHSEAWSTSEMELFAKIVIFS